MELKRIIKSALVQRSVICCEEERKNTKEMYERSGYPFPDSLASTFSYDEDEITREKKMNKIVDYVFQALPAEDIYEGSTKLNKRLNAYIWSGVGLIETYYSREEREYMSRFVILPPCIALLGQEPTPAYVVPIDENRD